MIVPTKHLLMTEWAVIYLYWIHNCNNVLTFTFKWYFGPKVKLISIDLDPDYPSEDTKTLKDLNSCNKTDWQQTFTSSRTQSRRSLSLVSFRFLFYFLALLAIWSFNLCDFKRQWWLFCRWNLHMTYKLILVSMMCLFYKDTPSIPTPFCVQPIFANV